MKTTPPRLRVLNASNSDNSIILRRGPSEQVFSLLWDKSNDTFGQGQWLKGKIDADKCHMAPDGQHWVYRASKGNQAFAAIAKVPYLKALGFFPCNNYYLGHGYFVDSKQVYLVLSPDEDDAQAQERQQQIKQCPSNVEYGFEPPVSLSYPAQLLREGWLTGQDLPIQDAFCLIFYKIISPTHYLLKFYSRDYAYKSLPAPQSIKEDHALLSVADENLLAFADWEWADYQAKQNRLVYGHAGNIFAYSLSFPIVDEAQVLANSQLLLDTNNMVFEPLIAPY